MKVISTGDKVKFDNGLVLSSDFRPDCCAYNYLDFEQLHVGREFKDMTANAFLRAIIKKEDGFSIKDAHQVPAWVQARSEQNGYYSNGCSLTLSYKGKEYTTASKDENGWDDDTFSGEVDFL